MAITYNAPAAGSPSSAGSQIRTDFYQKQALIDLKKLQFFSQLADVTSMPKNLGKKIKRFHYIPMLDARNINDQGIDAAGAAMSSYVVTLASPLARGYATTALALASANAINAITPATAVLSNGGLTVTTTVRVLNCNMAQAAAVVASTPFATSIGGGSLYGSSKDVGTISGKLPALSENGGRVNRVGFKRVDMEGSISKFGFFDEYTQESMDFDTDADLQMHINREMLRGANEMTEDALQIDLLNSAGTIRYAGSATRNLEVSGATAGGFVAYGDLMRLSIDLDTVRTPKQTTIITGTRMVDTKVLNAARILYMGSELLPTIKGMKDLFGNQAFIPVEKYAAGGTTVTGEVGAIDQFRIVVVPEMMKWSGAGAAVSGSIPCYDNGSNYDVFPMLCVGDESFTTIGFQTDGKSVKFVITHKKPGVETADRNDPFGETGFMSIKWYYGFMALRPERIGLIKTPAML